MYTSYYNNSNLNDYNNLVSISRTKPKWFICRNYIELAPPMKLVLDYKHKIISDNMYIERYTKQLDKLNPKKVYNDLGKDAILLCWCPPNSFCHRYLVAKWIKTQLGITVNELPKLNLTYLDILKEKMNDD